MTGYRAALYTMRKEPVMGFGITITETLTLSLTLPMDIFCRTQSVTAYIAYELADERLCTQPFPYVKIMFQLLHKHCL